MYLGTRTDEEMTYQLLDQYVDAGGIFIDTANIYAHWVAGFKGGESETILGKWLKSRDNRSETFIATKVGFQYGDTVRGLRAGQIVDECEKSLRRLGIDTIDLYYAHVDDRNTPQEETLEAFDKLVQSGKVRFIELPSLAVRRGPLDEPAERLGRVRWHPTAIHISAAKTGDKL
jgi:aryl-alcohol dehydrogenase-like predicted oxidoreductase